MGNQRFLGKSELIFFHINTHKSIFLSSLLSSSVSQPNHNNIRGKKKHFRWGIYFVFIGKNSYRLDKHCSKLLSSQSVFALQSVSATFTLTRPVPLRITTTVLPTLPEDLSHQDLLKEKHPKKKTVWTSTLGLPGESGHEAISTGTQKWSQETSPETVPRSESSHGS